MNMNDDDEMYSFAAAPRKQQIQSSFSPGGPLKTSMRMGTSMTKSTSNNARPMTSVRAAGYSSRGRNPQQTAGATFDPFNQGARNGADSVKRMENPEEQIKIAEKKLNQIIEESVMAASEGNIVYALEKAKEAGKRERILTKQREQLTAAISTDPASSSTPSTLAAVPNLDLTYCVLLNLASCYHACTMYQEALNTYLMIAKNKLFNQSGRLRVNMGNIYFEQHKYLQAVKMYRMALDQIPNTNRDIRLKIMRNIGISFVRLGQYQDATISFENIVEANSDYHAAFNLILCYYALGDREKMKRGFQKLVQIKPLVIELFDDMKLQGMARDHSPGQVDGDDHHIDDHEVFNEDSLRAIARERKKASERYILLAAKLIAPNMESSQAGAAAISEAGYDWVVNTIKDSPHADIAFDLEIAKAVQFLKTKNFARAIDALKSFEKKDQKLIGTEGDYRNAEKYAEIGVSTDRYNAKAQTNMGNCYFHKGNYEKAKECYLEAVSVDALCVEAMYNLGLAYNATISYNEAIEWFEKLHSILKNSAEVIYQIASTYEKMGNLSQAMEMYNILISVVPTDPGILAKMGDLFVKENNANQAFQSYSESYRYFPSNLQVISWLGAYYVDCEIYDQAIHFFERATTIQPLECKWQLMIASCYRRSGNYQNALKSYKKINEKFPDNVECLRFLVRICTDLGMKDVSEYAEKLSRAELGKSLNANEDASNASHFELSVDTTPSHARNVGIAIQKKHINQGDDDENWNEDVKTLLP